MKKIPTILPKDPNDLGKVIPGKLIDGISYFKIKIDGTSCMIKDGVLYSRYDIKTKFKKKGKEIILTNEELKAKIPEGAIACQEPDEKSGHWPHWVIVKEDDISKKYILEAFNNLENKIDGTYEAIGPKIQGNPHIESKHIMIPHFSDKLNIQIDEEEMKENPYQYFEEFFNKAFYWEGLVAYNDKDEPIGKIRKSDYGIRSFQYNKASKLL